MEDHSQCTTYTFLHVHTLSAEKTQLIQIIQSSSSPKSASFLALICSKSSTAADGTGFFLDQVSHRSVIPGFFCNDSLPIRSIARLSPQKSSFGSIEMEAKQSNLYSRFLEAARAIKKMTGNYCNSYAQIKEVDTKNRQGCTNTAMQKNCLNSTHFIPSSRCFFWYISFPSAKENYVFCDAECT